ncbi:MAG: hypothetical protein J3R72DRAFT_226365 [Linnemannia gamsii]|nr:MAG: hypothetical protein J3R72DRAFT_226365 [Linnemannia gamsii]
MRAYQAEMHFVFLQGGPFFLASFFHSTSFAHPTSFSHSPLSPTPLLSPHHYLYLSLSAPSPFLHHPSRCDTPTTHTENNMASDSPGTRNESAMESGRHDSDYEKTYGIFEDAQYAGPIRYCVLKSWDPLSKLLTCAQDAKLLPAVKAIARLPEIDKSFNEDISAAERALRFKGLLIDKEDWKVLGTNMEASPWLDVAHHIKDTFLEPIKRQHPLPLRLVLDHPPDETLEIDVMPRTTLSFFVLACHLKTTIVVFSSRAKPEVYDPPSSNGVIALFHAIDAPERISRFEVLRFCTDKVIQWASPGLDHQQQPTVAKKTPNSQEPNSNMFTPFASHRHAERKRLKRPGKEITDDEKDDCKIQYRMAW